MKNNNDHWRPKIDQEDKIKNEYVKPTLSKVELFADQVLGSCGKLPADGGCQALGSVENS